MERVLANMSRNRKEFQGANVPILHPHEAEVDIAIDAEDDASYSNGLKY